MRKTEQICGVTHAEPRPIHELDRRVLGLSRGPFASRLGALAGFLAFPDGRHRLTRKANVEVEVDLLLVDPQTEGRTDPALRFHETPPIRVTTHRAHAVQLREAGVGLWLDGERGLAEARPQTATSAGPARDYAQMLIPASIA